MRLTINEAGNEYDLFANGNHSGRYSALNAAKSSARRFIHNWERISWTRVRSDEIGKPDEWHATVTRKADKQQ